MQIKQAIDKFIEHLRANERSPHTLSSYERDLTVFAKWLKAEHSSRKVNRITPDTMLSFFPLAFLTIGVERLNR